MMKKLEQHQASQSSKKKEKRASSVDEENELPPPPSLLRQLLLTTPKPLTKKVKTEDVVVPKSIGIKKPLLSEEQVQLLDNEQPKIKILRVDIVRSADPSKVDVVPAQMFPNVEVLHPQVYSGI